MTGAAPWAEKPVAGDLVAERLAAVTERIAGAQRSPGAVKVVAVTKGFGTEAVLAAVAAGIWDVGENYAQELLAKAAGAPAGVRWHFLGELQRNKVARLGPHVALWQGLGRREEANALARHAPGASVLVEVRLGAARGRPGADAGDVDALAGYASDAGLDVRGLMAVAPLGSGPDEARQCFREVARLGRSLGLTELSMGMSSDYELAVSEGATMVRLGRALFGERPRPGSPRPGSAGLR